MIVLVAPLGVMAGESRAGFIFFAYGSSYEATKTYLAEVASTVHSIVHNVNMTELGITIVTNFPGDARVAWLSHYKFIQFRKISMPTDDLVTGKQWITRVRELQSLPYNITYALDAGSIVCNGDIGKALLDIELGAWDVATQTTGRVYDNPTTPLGGFIVLQRTPGTTRMLKRWLELHQQTFRSGARDDQHDLRRAICEGERGGWLSTRRIHPRFAHYGRHLFPESPPLPAQTRMHTGPISVVHWTTRWGLVYDGDWLCNKLNLNPNENRYFIFDKASNGRIHEHRNLSDCLAYEKGVPVCDPHAVPDTEEYFAERSAGCL